MGVGRMMPEMDIDLQNRLLERLLGSRLINNAFRGTLVEAILAGALAPDWQWCADGWGSYDFELTPGLGLEVKQSAALQDWYREGDKPNPGRFDIRPRKQRWDDVQQTWIEKPGRAASIYVFAWHSDCDVARADHRDPQQWSFFVVLSSDLPMQNTISLSGIKARADAVGIMEVKEAVDWKLGLLARK